VDGELIAAAHEALVDQETADRIDFAIGSRRTTRSRTRQWLLPYPDDPHMLRGILYSMRSDDFAPGSLLEHDARRESTHIARCGARKREPRIRKEVRVDSLVPGRLDRGEHVFVKATRAQGGELRSFRRSTRSYP
jgi:hypothetical protein